MVEYVEKLPAPIKGESSPDAAEWVKGSLIAVLDGRGKTYREWHVCDSAGHIVHTRYSLSYQFKVCPCGSGYPNTACPCRAAYR